MAHEYRLAKSMVVVTEINHHPRMELMFRQEYGPESIDTRLGFISPERLRNAAQGEAKRQMEKVGMFQMAFTLLSDTKKGVLFLVRKEPIAIVEGAYYAFVEGLWPGAMAHQTSWNMSNEFGLLFVQDPSQPNKEYAISVPPQMRTVNEALLWTFNLPAGGAKFAPVIHT